MDAGWILWRRRRARLFLIGRISAVFFFLAAVALLDGVQALLRTGHDEIRMIAGESEGISGPCPFQNPVASDLVLRIPEDAPLTFELEGFFTGYLIGNGMWRGNLVAQKGAQTGVWRVTAFFRGLPEGQRFHVSVFADREAMQESSPSFLLRFGCEPFFAATLLFLAGLFFATVTFVLGRRNTVLLRDLGFSEIFRAQIKGDSVSLWCSAEGASVRVGEQSLVLDAEGHTLAHARVIRSEKNVFTLVSDNLTVTDGCLVCVQKQKDGLRQDASETQ
ncbi:MAG: hypothetical protein IJU76_06280 [Desulfovibrionaceae bacterium]|nr:hypothetical protein [Desulfovibrionaceae bacterium]